MRDPVISRMYTGEQDLQQMQSMLVEARALTSDWRYWHEGELQWTFFMVACHLDPQQFIRLWHNPDRKLVGFAILGEDPTYDYYILPGYEWIGIEDEALEWAEQRLAVLRDRDFATWGGRIISGARQDDALRIAFLTMNGFRRGEYAEVNFLRSLDEPIPDYALPAGYQVRSMAEGDISQRAATQREVWKPWTVGNVSDEDYTRLMRLPGYVIDLDVVAVAPDGTIAAYVNGWPDLRNWIGDFGPVGALPAYRRQGLTRLVLLECLRRMRAHGMERVCVSTGVANTPALRLYESIGFKPDNQYHEYVKGGHTGV